MDFPFLPPDLTARCNMLIAAHHREHGYAELPAILWHKETMAFIAGHDDTRILLNLATKAWRRRKANEYYTLLAAIVLALEMLGGDFAKWGTHFPEAQQRAMALLDEWFPDARTRLLDIYLPSREQLPPELLRRFGPAT